MSYETTLIDYINQVERSANLRPLILGGITGPGGGGGGPPGGFIGYLPQWRVSYDESELATMETAISGESLLDNLNHIRYMITGISGEFAVNVTEAPLDGFVYGRQNATWKRIINSGGEGGILVEEDPIFIASEAFLFESGDKSKLNGIEANANYYVLPVTSGDVLGGIKIGYGLEINEFGYLSATALGFGIEEAPIDGSVYGRRDAGWIEVSISGIGIEEAPIDGTPYVRQDAAWISSIEEAPIDDKFYVRHHGMWFDLAVINAIIDTDNFVYHINFGPTDGTYTGIGITKTGDIPWIDTGDGWIGQVGSVARNYPDTTTKTLRVWSTDGWLGVTEIWLNWNKCVGLLPSFTKFPNLTVLVADSNAWTGPLPDLSSNPLLVTVHLEGNGFSGTVPSFSTCTVLDYLRLDGCALTGTFPSFAACTLLSHLEISSNSFSGNLPSFNSNTALVYFKADNNGFSGVIPTFVSCTLLESFDMSQCLTTGYTSGSFSTQSNLSLLSLTNNYWTTDQVNALLAELVTSLSLPSRVTCTVYLNGNNMEPATDQGLTDKDTLDTAGWDVRTYGDA